MARSMTGCGEGLAALEGTSCRVEIRSVNNRHFKATIRCREGFHTLEPRIEAALRSRIRRGAIHVSLEVGGAAVPAGRRLDREQLAAYFEDWTTFLGDRRLPPDTGVEAILSLPGVLVDAAVTPQAAEAAWDTVAQAVGEALDQLDAMRQAEGAALAADMLSTCQEIEDRIAAIAARAPQVVEEQRLRLMERVARLLGDDAAPLNPDDVAREVALMADRSDIAEELVRLRSHVDQFRGFLAEDSPGRSLDFLAQELSREANTIASKSLDVPIAHQVVEVKSLVERLREQAQNIE
jgi:uncharacterized protein (TIGR00255 family)